jgi:hypothetical protein
MFISKEEFEEWMKRIMARFDRQDRKLDKMNKPHQTMLDGEILLDNQDLCQLLHVSKRTIQRYRNTGQLPFQRLYNKTYYKSSDVKEFIINNFNKKEGDGDGNDEKEDKDIDTDK